MCTAISFVSKDFYFGRNLDLEYCYDESVTITPRNYKFRFCDIHYAMIGMAYVQEGYPLYYDAVNECGLGVAGLNFPGNAFYLLHDESKENIAPFEFIPWVLSQCKTVDEAKELLNETNLADIDFSEKLKATPLHWLIADRYKSIVVEPLKSGLKIHDNPTGVLTNNPPFDMQMQNLNNYMNLSAYPARNTFSDKLDLKEYSRGMGAMGLPGDLSSLSRFVKAVFTKTNSVSGESEEEAVSQFFHILYSVYQQRGCVRLGDKYEITQYSSCCNGDKGIYYYTTYENSSITAVDMNRENLDTTELITYPLIKKQKFDMQN